ncbi:MAG: hypothetical protein VR68_12835 [Peptococcaceae bacterium BRH_c4a]|nr:MAG: hypothetical protein VR68_12835 [Peptococcaceae bacterium BRH_c4a]
MKELFVLLTALFCWLAYTLYLSASLIKKGRSSAEGVICVIMGNQAGLAEWFIRKMYSTEVVLSGQLWVAVSVEPVADGTVGIVDILWAEKEFLFVEPEERSRVIEELNLNPWLIDIRGMDRTELLKGPLHSLANYKSAC